MADFRGNKLTLLTKQGLTLTILSTLWTHDTLLDMFELMIAHFVNLAFTLSQYSIHTMLSLCRNVKSIDGKFKGCHQL